MIKITKARKSHVPEIIELWKEFMDFHKKIDPFFTRSPRGHKQFEEFINKSFGSRKKQLFVALDDKKVIGYAYIQITKYPPVFDNLSFGFITDLAVNRKYRRRGIGTVLLSEVKKWFLKKGITRIELSVAYKNKIGHSFWNNTGFKEFIRKMYLEI